MKTLLHIHVSSLMNGIERSDERVAPIDFTDSWAYVRRVWNEADPGHPVWIALAIYQSQEGKCCFQPDVISPGELTTVARERFTSIVQNMLIKFSEM